MPSCHNFRALLPPIPWSRACVLVSLHDDIRLYQKMMTQIACWIECSTADHILSFNRSLSDWCSILDFKHMSNTKVMSSCYETALDAWAFGLGHFFKFWGDLRVQDTGLWKNKKRLHVHGYSGVRLLEILSQGFYMTGLLKTCKLDPQMHRALPRYMCTWVTHTFCRSETASKTSWTQEVAEMHYDGIWK